MAQAEANRHEPGDRDGQRARRETPAPRQRRPHIAFGLTPLTDYVVHQAARPGSLTRAREHRFYLEGEAMVDEGIARGNSFGAIIPFCVIRPFTHTLHLEYFCPTSGPR